MSIGDDLVVVDALNLDCHSQAEAGQRGLLGRSNGHAGMDLCISGYVGLAYTKKGQRSGIIVARYSRVCLPAFFAVS